MNLTTSSVPAEVEKKILTAIELKKQLEQYEQEIKEELFEAMKANDITSIKNDKYTVTIAKRTNYKANDVTKVPATLLKLTLDTAKVGQHAKLYGELPDGIETSETEYLTWRSR